MEINEFVNNNNNNNIEEIFDKLDKQVFLETAHLSNFFQLDDNKHYKINPVNFDGVFGNVRLPQDNFTHTNYINYSKNNYK